MFRMSFLNYLAVASLWPASHFVSSSALELGLPCGEVVIFGLNMGCFQQREHLASLSLWRLKVSPLQWLLGWCGTLNKHKLCGHYQSCVCRVQEVTVPEPQVYIMWSSNPAALSTAVGLLLVPLIQRREIGGSRPVANPLDFDGTKEIVNAHLHGSFAEALVLLPRWPAMPFEFTQRSPTWLFASVLLSLFYICDFSTCFQNYFFCSFPITLQR